MFLPVLLLFVLSFDAVPAAVTCLTNKHNFCNIINQTVSDQEAFKIDRPDDVPLTNIIVLNSDIANLISSVLTSYPRITFLSISNGCLKALKSESFANAKKLKTLFITRENLPTIKSFTFTSCSSLEELQLSSNHVEELEENAFDGLSNLKLLGLSKNKLKALHPTLFTPLTNLESLSLEQNIIKELNPKQFLYNPNLIHVSFGSNLLTEVPTDLFKANRKINYINFSNNSIQNIRTFGVPEIDVSLNRLKTLRIDSKAKTLHLQDNSIETIDCTDVDVSSVERLHAHNNSLTNFNCIREMENIKTLSINNNNISAQIDVLSDLSNLKKLLNLAVDYLNYTKLHETFPKLFTIFLTTNNWNCTIGQNVANILNQQNIFMRFTNNYLRHDCNITRNFTH